MKQSFSLEQHTNAATVLAKQHLELERLRTELWLAYPVKSRPVRAVEKALRQLHELRNALEEVGTYEYGPALTYFGKRDGDGARRPG